MNVLQISTEYSFKTGLRGMLYCKAYRSLQLFFPFVFSYTNTWMGFVDENPFTKDPFKYTKPTNLLMSDNHSKGRSYDD